METYGPGQWVQEPDKVTFLYDSFECEIVRDLALGHLTGRVFVPQQYGGGSIQFTRNKTVDIIPKTTAISSLLEMVMNSVDREVTYKTVDFVAGECNRIIQEIKEEHEYKKVFLNEREALYEKLRKNVLV